MIKAVIFDIYGTLLKSKAGDLDNAIQNRTGQFHALRKLKKKYRISVGEKNLFNGFIDEIKRDHARNEKRGIRYPEVIIENVWKRVLKRLGIKKRINYRNFAYDYYILSEKRTLYPGVKELLKRLKKGKIKIGIISNAQFYTEIQMNKLFKTSIYNYFDRGLVFYSFKEWCSKPNQKSFDKLKKRLKGIKKKEILYVGNNMIKDISAANKAGVLSCLIINPETVFGKGIKPDYRIKNLKEILKIV